MKLRHLAIATALVFASPVLSYAQEARAAAKGQGIETIFKGENMAEPRFKTPKQAEEANPILQAVVVPTKLGRNSFLNELSETQEPHAVFKVTNTQTREVWLRPMYEGGMLQINDPKNGGKVVLNAWNVTENVEQTYYGCSVSVNAEYTVHAASGDKKKNVADNTFMNLNDSSVMNVGPYQIQFMGTMDVSKTKTEEAIFGVTYPAGYELVSPVRVGSNALTISLPNGGSARIRPLRTFGTSNFGVMLTEASIEILGSNGKVVSQKTFTFDRQNEDNNKLEIAPNLYVQLKGLTPPMENNEYSVLVTVNEMTSQAINETGDAIHGKVLQYLKINPADNATQVVLPYGSFNIKANWATKAYDYSVEAAQITLSGIEGTGGVPITKTLQEAGASNINFTLNASTPFRVFFEAVTK